MVKSIIFSQMIPDSIGALYIFYTMKHKYQEHFVLGDFWTEYPRGCDMIRRWWWAGWDTGIKFDQIENWTKLLQHTPNWKPDMCLENKN